MLALLVAIALAPMSSPDGWIAASDYPLEALQNGEEGTVSVSLAVDASGQTVGCEVSSSSKSTALDQATCKVLLERARFAPDSSNNGKSRVMTLSVVWKIPPASPVSVSLTGVLATATIDENSRVIGCKEEIFGDSRIGEADICDMVSNPRALEYFTGSPIVPSSHGYVRLYYRPVEDDRLTVTGNAAGIVPKILVDANFSVLPTGFATGCKVNYIDPLLPAEGLCEVFSSEHPDFDPDKTRTKPQAMRLILDAWMGPAESKTSN
jgi:TonB family protein